MRPGDAARCCEPTTRTGKDAGAVHMPAPQSGSPMIYMMNGQQHIVIAAERRVVPGELLAYRVPGTRQR
jgi:quinoprotein glucose dehydrogenase